MGFSVPFFFFILFCPRLHTIMNFKTKLYINVTNVTCYLLLEGGNISNTDFNFARLLDTLIYQVGSQPNQVPFMPTT